MTITEGTSTLVGRDPRRIVEEAVKVLDGGGKAERIPELWDGCTAGRIAEVFKGFGVERGLLLA